MRRSVCRDTKSLAEKKPPTPPPLPSLSTFPLAALNDAITASASATNRADAPFGPALRRFTLAPSSSSPSVSASFSASSIPALR